MKTSSCEDHRDMNKCPQKLCPSYEIADISGKKGREKEGENKKHIQASDLMTTELTGV